MNTTKPVQSLLTLTAEEMNRMKLSDPPMIRMGDALVFEANRGGFLLEIFLSNGKEIITTAEDGPGTVVGWRKGRAKLDYLESLNQYIVGMKVTPAHEDGTPLLLRGVRIDRKGSYILELEKTHPAPAQSIPDPPMSYPPDPHVMTASVTMPNLLGREQPQTGFMAPRIPAFSIAPMMFQSSTGTSDPNHYKYIGREFDDESGLYYMGARHYNPGLGRFIQPDPLYITHARLSDPQQLNLYAYSRNNPTTFSDPTGLDVKLNCEGGQKDCNTALDQFNGREKAGFKAGLDKNNKLTAHLSKAEYNKLSKAEKALYNAINNTSNHAMLNIVGSSGSADFGTHESKGVNTVDLGNISKLNGASNAGGLNAGDVIAHESLEAYHSLTDEAGAHAFASQFFPGLSQPLNVSNTTNASNTRVLGETYDQRISDGRGSERVTIQFNSPIPAIDLFTRGAQAVHDAGTHVEGVTFVPKPPEK